MKAINQANDFVLAAHVETAKTFWSRMKGLLGRANLPEGYGMLITNCNGIHMFFMRFAIDAVFLDYEGKVLAILRDFKPWRVSKMYWGAKNVLELPAGTVKHNVKNGDVILFN
ncbi:hypothetical protein AAIR98_001162 [Elusimicrobium simillimum]|uniref:DUF192 domain-containing protein n=1 Tax=Elusimicrobium simillimum TaxID=3143438 RepID=UPI003C6EFAB6